MKLNNLGYQRGVPNLKVTDQIEISQRRIIRWYVNEIDQFGMSFRRTSYYLNMTDQF